jgi:hypothetical protein
MAENAVRPPEAPTPSNTSISNTNRLKNRLILGMSKLPTDTGEPSSLSTILGPATSKGFGEDQFDIADAAEPGRSVLGLSSSLWSENSFVKKLGNSSVIASNTRVPTHGQRSHLRGFTDSQAGGTTGTKRRLSSMLLTKGSLAGDGRSTVTSERLNKKLFGSQAGSAKARRMEKLNANIMPHLSVSQHYQGDGEWDDVASSMAFGEAEFCYLKSDAKDAYKFSIQENHPSGRILKNDFTTMSRFGVLRNSSVTGESELVPHEDMLLEQDIYHKLVQLRVFRQFRLWKPFAVWHRTVKRNKFNNAVSLVQRVRPITTFYPECLVLAVSCLLLFSRMLLTISFVCM